MTAVLDTNLTTGYTRTIKNDGTNNATLVGNKPAALADGEILLAILTVGLTTGANTITAPAGFTQIFNNQAITSNGVHTYIGYKVAGGSEPGTYTFNMVADGRDDQLLLIRVTGANTSTFLAASASGTDATTVSPVCPSITTTGTNDLALFIVSQLNGSALTADDAGNPTGTTLFFSKKTRVNSSGVNTGASSQLYATAQATGTKTWSNYVTSVNRSTAISFAIKAAAASYAINSTNSGANVLNADAVNTASVTGYAVGVNPIVSGTVGSLALTSVSQATTIATFTIPAPVNDSYYPQPDTSHTLTLTDGSNPSTFNAVMNSLAGYTSIVLASPDLADTHKIPYWLTSTAVNNDRIMSNPAHMIVAADGGISGATLGVTTIYYHWRVADSTIYIYDALLGEEGIISATVRAIIGSKIKGNLIKGNLIKGHYL